MNNGLYGFVDRNNKVVIPAAYENVSFFDQQGYAQARQNGLYGIINKSGQWVVPLLEKNPISYSSMVKNLKTGTDQLDQENTGIYMIDDKSKGEWFLFSPASKLKVSPKFNFTTPPFEDKLTIEGRKSIESNVFHYGYKKIPKPSGLVNFIDTTFREVLPSDVVNGAALSEDYFVIYNETGKAGFFFINPAPSSPASHMTESIQPNFRIASLFL